MPGPVLSLIVIILQGREALQRCLMELQKQSEGLSVEIIVPCDESFTDLASFRSSFPKVHFLQVQGYRTFAELRSLGVLKGVGDIVAVTEDQCRPCEDWCEVILKDHQKPYAAVGGAVEKDVPDSSLAWAFFFADYVRYMNPISEGETNHLTDCNVSYKQSALRAITTIWKKEFHEPEVHAALQGRGEILWFSPRMVVFQKRSMTLQKALKDRFTFGRLFGSGRLLKASLPRRIFFSGAALLLPPVTVLRVARNVFQKSRCIPEFIRALPFLALLNSVWALGECIGYLTGRAAPVLTPGLRKQNISGLD